MSQGCRAESDAIWEKENARRVTQYGRNQKCNLPRRPTIQKSRARARLSLSAWYLATPIRAKQPKTKKRLHTREPSMLTLRSKRANADTRQSQRLMILTWGRKAWHNFARVQYDWEKRCTFYPGLPSSFHIQYHFT